MASDYLINSAGKKLFFSHGSTTGINGTAGDDHLFGTAGNDFLFGGDGIDVLTGGAGEDQYVDAGKQTFIERPNEGVDTVISYADVTILSDNIENLNTGHWGIGNELDNIVWGREGSQNLDGGKGDDVLVGDIGADTFVIRKGEGSDVIADFETGANGDTVRLDGSSFTDFNAVRGAMTQVGSDVVLKLDDSSSLTFRNHQVADFSADDFAVPMDRSNLSLTFSDEFNSLSARSPANNDTGVWRTDFGWGYDSLWSRTLPGNSEKEVYVDPGFKGETNAPMGLNPFSIDHGVLTITAEKATPADAANLWDYQYTSGVITTKDTFAQQYGYFEMRAKLPDVQGMWPAFWLVPADGSWPPEIDILESIGDASKVYQTSHTQATGTHTQDSTFTHVYDTPDDFHTFGMNWTADTLTWYVDGIATKQIATSADMNKPMYVIVSLGVGGSWPGDPAADFTSAAMEIDYIRAYSNSQTPHTTDPNESANHHDTTGQTDTTNPNGGTDPGDTTLPVDNGGDHGGADPNDTTNPETGGHDTPPPSDTTSPTDGGATDHDTPDANGGGDSTPPPSDTAKHIDLTGSSPNTYMSDIRDFDGNDLGAHDAWQRIGQVDIQGDGDLEYLYVNQQLGRWATVGPDANGMVDFADHGLGGDTRVVGVYLDPLVEAGLVQRGSDIDSQQRFQHDLQAGNIGPILGAGDYNHDGLQEIYFGLNDHSAYLHAYMHADGNIQYANYQNQQQVIDYLTGAGQSASTWSGWFA